MKEQVCPNCKGTRMSVHDRAMPKSSKAIGKVSCLDCWRTYDVMEDGRLSESYSSRAVNTRR